MIARARMAIATAGALAVAVGLVFSCGIDAQGERVGGGTGDARDDGVPPGQDGTTADGPDGGDPDAIPIDAPTGCPTDHGAMRLVSADGGSFCIDETEVTNAAYDAFLAAVDGGFDAGLAAKGGNAALCAGALSVER